MAEHDLIEEYLAQLRVRLRGAPEHREDVVAELRDHLLETTESVSTQGLAARDAELVSIGRLGSVDEVARFYGGRRRPRRPGSRALAATACAIAIASLSAGVLIAAAPFGHNPELARRLGIEPKALQEPSRVEINGVPLPRAIPADDPQFQAIAERIAILDG